MDQRNCNDKKEDDDREKKHKNDMEDSEGVQVGRKRMNRKDQKARKRKRQKRHHGKELPQQDRSSTSTGNNEAQALFVLDQDPTVASNQQHQETLDPKQQLTSTPPKTKKLKKKKKKKCDRKNKKNNSLLPEKTEEAHDTTQEQHDQVGDTPNTNVHSFDESLYVPTPIPTILEFQKAQGAKPLGKWFPKAVVVKSKEPPTQQKSIQASLLLFYQYVDPLWPESVTDHLISYLLKIAQVRVLGGRLRISREGVNATLSSRDTENSTAAATLRHFTKDLIQFDSVFQKTDFKFLDHLSGDRHFKDFKLFPVKELVYYGFKDPLQMGGVHLSAQEFHQKLSEPDTVVVDVRNHYEAAMGRFDGQMVASNTTRDDPLSSNQSDTDKDNPNNQSNPTQTGGAIYVDPKMRKSTDFAGWLQKPETISLLAGKQVLMYCTGGVRCERASAHLNHNMGNQLAGVYQLQGGIERYLQAFPQGGYWRGKNFVFDKREACAPNDPNGDGGVVTKTINNNNNTLLPEMKCCTCQKPWNRYVGKKKCDTCGVPVLMCDVCMSKDGSNKNTVPQQSEKQTNSSSVASLIRCPLCVEQNITVPAQCLDWTDNGVNAVCTPVNPKKDEEEEEESRRKAAPSVLKWGGGHALQKKERRWFQRKPCKFGAECKRSECFFAH